MHTHIKRNPSAVKTTNKHWFIRSTQCKIESVLALVKTLQLLTQTRLHSISVLISPFIQSMKQKFNFHFKFEKIFARTYFDIQMKQLQKLKICRNFIKILSPVLFFQMLKRKFWRSRFICQPTRPLLNPKLWIGCRCGCGKNNSSHKRFGFISFWVLKMF